MIKLTGAGDGKPMSVNPDHIVAYWREDDHAI